MSDPSAELRSLAEDAYRALNAGDFSRFLALVAEDVEFTSMVAEAEGTVFRGHDGARAWWETVRGAFDQPRWELLEVDGTDDRGVAKFRLKGRLGGVPVEHSMWQAVRFREGKARWWAFFRSEGEAREAVGLLD